MHSKLPNEFKNAYIQNIYAFLKYTSNEYEMLYTGINKEEKNKAFRTDRLERRETIYSNAVFNAGKTS